MRSALRIASLAWVFFCLSLLLARPLWAGDCASPDDCSAIPDNGTKAACVGGVIAGVCIYERTRKDDPEFGEGRIDDESVILGGDSGPAQPATTPDAGDHTTVDTSPPETKKPDILNKPLGGDDLF